MKAKQLKSNQSALKNKYKEHPESAIQTLSASGMVDFGNLAFDLETPKQFVPAGLHESAGGDGSFACSVEILLAAWVSCAGVTLAAVADAMNLDIKSCRIEGSGKMDFRGTLAVSKNTPVGLVESSLRIEINSNEAKEALEKLVELTERYCVVHQTLSHSPKVSVKLVKD